MFHKSVQLKLCACIKLKFNDFKILFGNNSNYAVNYSLNVSLKNDYSVILKQSSKWIETYTVRRAFKYR